MANQLAGSGSIFKSFVTPTSVGKQQLVRPFPLKFPSVNPFVGMTTSTRLKYTTFKGRGQDPDGWLGEFLSTAKTNKENADPDLLRIFEGLMKNEAHKWYTLSLTPAIQGS